MKPDFIYFSDKIIPVRRILLITKEKEFSPFFIEVHLNSVGSSTFGRYPDDSTDYFTSESFDTEEERDRRFDELLILLNGS